MDSITHIALGACVGEAFFERGFGKKAMVWGALAQSIPDIDFVASFWLPTSDDLLVHRGFTHSLLFALMIVPLMAVAANRIHHPRNISYRKWFLFFAVEVGLHLFLDAFNNYGIGWLEPFSHARYSFNTIYVLDFFFSIWPVIAMIALIFLHPFHKRRKFWWLFGVVLPFLYLGYGVFNKLSIDRDVKKMLAQQKISYNRYFTTPAPMQNWLWFVVAGNDSGYYVGFRSVFDRQPQLNLEYFPRHTDLLDSISDHREVKNLVRFSQQFYVVQQWNDTLVFNDLRFGQIFGWEEPQARFVFHYFLQHPDDNHLVVQRGRFLGWDAERFKAYLRRIRGN